MRYLKKPFLFLVLFLISLIIYALQNTNENIHSSSPAEVTVDIMGNGRDSMPTKKIERDGPGVSDTISPN
ncbi:hypothetical protein [Pricia sp.]|uniref:hypothetical protein n=1 Tax=Pricia sp. TaxID=2268138 RepID=UPI003593E625